MTSRPIGRLLVANRGEIARRVFATCRRLGIQTVAVHSDADAELPFVREADVAVRLPGNTPTETYLRGDLVIDAARRAGADAIHPGYGFLSENADFARAVRDAGLVWVGPQPESIASMGSKVEAKKLMDAAGVPVLGDLGVDTATEEELPLLVKASAGGGGRGMRVVRALGDLPGAVSLAAAEAESAFGDPTVFVEPYVERGRHIEVQVVGDTEGTVLVLGERDCSVQRRHQKVVEEAPAPALPEETRRALHEAAAAAARAIGYVGAGTVEFLVDATEPSRFWFLEMNTRLQVEHPVTELVHGVDLVALQVDVAEGRPVPTEPPAPRGHAVEARLYAEEPAADYQPQSGVLETLEIADVDCEFGPLAGDGIRLDAGFETGNEVGTFYDPMLAKVVAWAPTRDQALRRLAGALSRSRIHGVTTNRDQLVAILRDPRFADAGDLSTALLAEPGGLLGEERTDAGAAGGPHVAAALALAADLAARRTVQRGIPAAWRNVVSQPQRTVLADGDEELVVEWWGGRDGFHVDGATVVEARPDLVVLEDGGVRTRWQVRVTPGTVHVDGPGSHRSFRRVPRFTDPADAVASGSLLAPMPGTVTAVSVQPGTQVASGQQVLVLEAMKMQHAITAPNAGVVAQIPVAVGDQVAAGAVLAVVDEGEKA